MSDYTPTTGHVRFNYTAYDAEHTRRGLSGATESEFDAEFDRWHAEEIRKAKAEAWDQGVLDGAAYTVIGASAPPNPYREESAGD